MKLYDLAAIWLLNITGYTIGLISEITWDGFMTPLQVISFGVAIVYSVTKLVCLILDRFSKDKKKPTRKHKGDL